MPNNGVLDFLFKKKSIQKKEKNTWNVALSSVSLVLYLGYGKFTKTHKKQNLF